MSSWLLRRTRVLVIRSQWRNTPVVHCSTWSVCNDECKVLEIEDRVGYHYHGRPQWGLARVFLSLDITLVTTCVAKQFAGNDGLESIDRTQFQVTLGSSNPNFLLVVCVYGVWRVRPYQTYDLTGNVITGLHKHYDIDTLHGEPMDVWIYPPRPVVQPCTHDGLILQPRQYDHNRHLVAEYVHNSQSASERVRNIRSVVEHKCNIHSAAERECVAERECIQSATKRGCNIRPAVSDKDCKLSVVDHSYTNTLLVGVIVVLSVSLFGGLVYWLRKRRSQQNKHTTG